MNEYSGFQIEHTPTYYVADTGQLRPYKNHGLPGDELEFVLKTPCVQLGGSLVFFVQPLRTKADVAAAVNSALAGSA